MSEVTLWSILCSCWNTGGTGDCNSSSPSAAQGTFLPGLTPEMAPGGGKPPAGRALLFPLLSSLFPCGLGCDPHAIPLRTFQPSLRQLRSALQGRKRPSQSSSLDTPQRGYPGTPPRLPQGNDASCIMAIPEAFMGPVGLGQDCGSPGELGRPSTAHLVALHLGLPAKIQGQVSG